MYELAPLHVCPNAVRDVYPTLRYCIILLAMRETYQSAVQEVYQNLPAEIRKSTEVRRAINLSEAMHGRNYVRFFSGRVVYLLGKEWSADVETISLQVEMRDKRSAIPEPLPELARIMGFSNVQDTVEWLLIKGVPADEKGAHIYKANLPEPKTWSETN
ncbi:hypothetical protein T484DRAFT_1781983 [Baffinella frigidus]|nr:hypothetical protein T484DRAFT_1781983 [Cryptophyta sp. CCMP2293]